MTRIGPFKRYPDGPITPHGAYYMLNNKIPLVALRSYDDSVVFNLMGGLAIPDRQKPERVELKELRGLLSPWTIIDQKGASQDGVTFVDALYDPIEIELNVRAVGRNPAYLRQVVRDLVASIDTKKESELSFFTHYMGRWWAPVRWFKTPENPIDSIPSKRQELSLRLRADNAFWQSYPNVDQFRFTYTTNSDNFDFFTAPGDPITGWTTAYSGAGTGVLHTNGSEAISTVAGARTSVARRTGFTATTDNMVVEIELGTSPEWLFPGNTYIDVWGRMNNTGTPGTDGVRFRISQYWVTLSSFNAGVETVHRDVLNFWPWPGEKYSFVFGTEGEPRTFKALRNNAPFLTYQETGTTSLVNSSHRKAGFGQSVVAGTTRPMALRSWSAGDNNTVLQEGFVQRINVGDQTMWDRYTCFGPGMFYFANGPGSSEMVKFGPLLPNQVMQVCTDPRKRSVVDLTSVPPSPQEIAMFNTAKLDFFSFFSQSNVKTSPQATESIFGIVPPQGNPYALLNGRFSAGIPPRSPGKPVDRYHVKVKIDDGNSDSQIIAAGTPLRRLPY